MSVDVGYDSYKGRNALLFEATYPVDVASLFYVAIGFPHLPCTSLVPPLASFHLPFIPLTSPLGVATVEWPDQLLLKLLA